MKTLKEIMSTDCVTVTRQDTIFDVAMKMKEHDIGFIPVVENRTLTGVVTDRDLVIRGLANKFEGSETVEKVISKDIVTVSSDTSVDEASKIMAREQVRRLPVVDQGELVGIVAIADLAVRQIFVNEAGEALSEISEQRGELVGS